jgi:hypothetical protein
LINVNTPVNIAPNKAIRTINPDKNDNIGIKERAHKH